MVAGKRQQKVKKIKKSQQKTIKGGRVRGAGGFGRVFDVMNDDDVKILLTELNMIVKDQNINEVIDKIFCKIGENDWKPIRQCYDKLQHMALKFFFVKEGKTQANANANFKEETNMFKNIYNIFTGANGNIDDTLLIIENNKYLEEVLIRISDDKERTLKFVPSKLCDGTIADLIKKNDNSTLSPITFEKKHILDIVETIANFLIILKNQSYHHNDIKEDNIMVVKYDTEYKFFVGDYGLISESIKGGTKGYQSPFHITTLKEQENKTEGRYILVADELEREKREKYINNEIFKIVTQKDKDKFFYELTKDTTKQKLFSQYNNNETSDYVYEKNDIFAIGIMLMNMLYKDVIHEDAKQITQGLIGDMLFINRVEPSLNLNSLKVTRPVTPVPAPAKKGIFGWFGRQKQAGGDDVIVLGKSPIKRIEELVTRVKTLKKQHGIPLLKDKFYNIASRTSNKEVAKASNISTVNTGSNNTGNTNKKKTNNAWNTNTTQRVNVNTTTRNAKATPRVNVNNALNTNGNKRPNSNNARISNGTTRVNSNNALNTNGTMRVNSNNALNTNETMRVNSNNAKNTNGTARVNSNNGRIANSIQSVYSNNANTNVMNVKNTQKKTYPYKLSPLSEIPKLPPFPPKNAK